MKKMTIFLLGIVVLPNLVQAASYQLKPDLWVRLPDVMAPWTVSMEPCSHLIEHLTSHVLEEAGSKGKELSEEKARQIALKRARNNQLFVMNQKSGARLLISFSRLKEGETAPSFLTVASSAKNAAAGVAGEGWRTLSERYAVTAIKGAQLAQWFFIDYALEGQRNMFMGIVGFADPYWFWLYGYDQMKDPRDREVLEKLMLGFKVQSYCPCRLRKNLQESHSAAEES